MVSKSDNEMIFWKSFDDFDVQSDGQERTSKKEEIENEGSSTEEETDDEERNSEQEIEIRRAPSTEEEIEDGGYYRGDVGFDDDVMG
eukprot:CAMPEP_0175051574 /NCGR_PEP_ID=MMETSP0052_2-20121109/7883_1 /TAXON_ID=51329 ORGANISM="Polytomella parva, Strain SAG 63-3" /NCGR_SAMPLE_ID=MMETSP0052_2 /ASSEMBLY_ACC=CAM_ASM_000194 /LENGTH=86 /DNA_ID=CAMNT_0016315889 /DNA_START=9 /DNA_END=269 /DNA_ORIENTATION=+